MGITDRTNRQIEETDSQKYEKDRQADRQTWTDRQADGTKR